MASSGFYVLSPDGRMFGTKWAYGEIVEPSNTGEAKECPVCGHAVSLMEWLPPHRITLSSANPAKWGDFVWGAGFNLLVSERFHEIYQQEGLTGITSVSPPVEIVRVGKLRTGDLPPNLPTYRLIDVIWNGANQDDVASGVRHRDPGSMSCWFCRVSPTGKVQDAVVLDRATWVGADLFVPRGAPVPMMGSERFKEVAEQYRLTNVRVVPGENLAYDEYPSADDPGGLRQVRG